MLTQTLHFYCLLLILLSTIPGQTCSASQGEDNAPLQIHVSPKGDNANPGTQAKPFGDLNAVLKKLSQLHAEKINSDVTVILHDGTYPIEQPLIITPEHLPMGKHSLTFQAAKNAKPIISGGRLIKGWKKNENGTFSVRLEQVANGKWGFRELFVQGKRRPRARHPNKGFHRIVKAAKDRRTGFTFKPGEIPEGLGAGAELVFLHDWSISRVAVKDVDHKANTLSVMHNIGCIAPHYSIDHFETHPRYYLENHPALLDQPGEWYLDQKTGMLTYYPFPEETPEKLEVIAPVVSRLLTVRGTERQSIDNVHFHGISFEHAAWQLPAGGYASGQASIHEWRDSSPRHSSRKMMESAILFELAQNCSMRDCKIRHLGASGVWFGSRTHRCQFVGNLMEDISGNSLNLGEITSRRVKGKSWWQSAPEQAASDHVVANNLIQRGGQQFFGCVAIWIGIASHVHVHHNEIRDHPYTGISLGWMWNPTPTPAGKHIIEHNHIHHVMQKLSDGGGIYTLGRQPGTFLRNNHIHDVPLNAGRAQSNGMFLDQGSDEIQIVENLIYKIARSPLRFHQGKKIVVTKNILIVENKQIAPYTYNRTDPATVERTGNTVLTAKEFRLSLGKAIIEKAGVQEKYRERLGLKDD